MQPTDAAVTTAGQAIKTGISSAPSRAAEDGHFWAAMKEARDGDQHSLMRVLGGAVRTALAYSAKLELAVTCGALDWAVPGLGGLTVLDVLRWDAERLAKREWVS